MEWFILPDGRTCLPEGTILKFEYQGGYYRILGAPVGYGGAGIIYPAVRVVRKEEQWEPENMWVALKECYPQSTDGMLRREETGAIVSVGTQEDYAAEYYSYAKEMMRREKEVTGQIFNRGFRLTPVWDIVEQEEIAADGEHFFPAENQYSIMERLDEKGSSLGKILESRTGGCLTAYETICVTEKILQAVSEVHKEGYLHGDIQANNIFLKGQKNQEGNESGSGYEDSVASLIDFGSARPFLEDGATAMITDRKLYTTNGYRAPECVTGNDGTLRLTKAADLYSVGYLMLRMITGKYMDAKALQLVVNGKYLYGRQAKKIGCPTTAIDMVNRILEYALKELPEERYQTAEEMLEDISRLKRALAPEKSRIASVDYDAFISYAHETSSIRAAEKIQKMLERYRIPKAVQKMTGRKKLNRIFRDREELACSSDMEAHLQEALEHSEFLIVLLSPKVPESQWVQREIELFLKHHDRNHVLTVLTEGELNEVYPDILRQEEKLESGQLKLRPVEGLAADVRCDSDGSLKKKLKTEIYRLLAPILGCSFDELRQRQREYVFRRTVSLMTAGMIVFGAAAGYMGWQAYQIQENYREALRRQSRYLAQVSEDLLEKGDRQAAVQVALEALPESSEDDSMPLVPEAEAALANSVYAYQGVWSAATYRSADFQMEMDSDSLQKETISPDRKKFMAMDENQTVYIWNVEERILKRKWNREFWEAQGVENEVLHCEFLDDETVLIMTQDRFLHISLETETCTGSYILSEDPQWHSDYQICKLSEDREYLAVGRMGIWRDTDIYVYRTGDGSVVYETDKTQILKELMEEQEKFSAVCISPDNRYAAAGFHVWYDKETKARGAILVIDLQTGEQTVLSDAEYGVYDLRFTEDNRLIALTYAPTEDSFYRVNIADLEMQIQCYDPAEWEVSWKTDLNMQLSTTGGYGLWTESDDSSVLVWCSSQMVRLNMEDGSPEEYRSCERDIASVQTNTNSGYLIGDLDGNLYLFLDGGFWRLGTNVTAQTHLFLDDGKGRSYLVSSEGRITALKATVDPNKKETALNAKEAGVVTFEEDPYYIVYFGEDDHNRMEVYSSPDDILLYEIEAEGFLEDVAFLEDGKICCYLENLTGLELRVNWYDTENKCLRNSEEIHFSESNVKLGKTAKGENLLLCYDDQKICLLDLDSGEWKEEILLADNPACAEKETSRLIQAYLTKDGRYIAAVENDSVFDDEGRAYLQLYDREAQAWVELPEEIRQLRMKGSYRELVFMAEEKNLAAVYEESRHQLVLIDLEQKQIIQEIPFDGTEQRQVKFLSEDEAILLWGNDNYLKLWDIREGRIRMEDRRKMYQVKLIQTFEEEGLIEVQGLDEASTELYRGNLWQVWLYRLEKDGTFYPYVPLWNGFYDKVSNRIGAFGWDENCLMWYEPYSLDELLEKGKETAAGYTLSEADKVKYFMESGE